MWLGDFWLFTLLLSVGSQLEASSAAFAGSLNAVLSVEDVVWDAVVAPPGESDSLETTLSLY